VPEIGTPGLMSEDGKRGVGHRPQATAPILDSTLASFRCDAEFGRYRRHSGHGWTCRWVAPVANDPLPAVRCKRFVDLAVSGLASMYPALIGACGAHHGYQRACDLVNGQHLTAGTRFPSASTRTSPRTTSRPVIRLRMPSRMTSARGIVRSLSASRTRSVRVSCTTVISTDMVAKTRA
jgi:hypothetical protein